MCNFEALFFVFRRLKSARFNLTYTVYHEGSRTKESHSKSLFNCWDNLNDIFDQTSVPKINRILQSDSLQQRMSSNFVKQTVNRRQTTYAGDKYTESHLQLFHLRVYPHRASAATAACAAAAAANACQW